MCASVPFYTPTQEQHAALGGPGLLASPKTAARTSAADSRQQGDALEASRSARSSTLATSADLTDVSSSGRKSLGAPVINAGGESAVSCIPGTIHVAVLAPLEMECCTIPSVFLALNLFDLECDKALCPRDRSDIDRAADAPDAYGPSLQLRCRPHKQGRQVDTIL